jgi:hypothetical protein
MICTSKLHDHNNGNLWHRWIDEKGRRFATPCPVTYPPKEQDEPRYRPAERLPYADK